MGLDLAAISAHVMFRSILIMLYVVTGGLVIWRLYPRLSSPAKYLASAMLVAQIVLVAFSLELLLPVEYQWVYDVDREWNIPTTVASTQLALVAAVALVTAWLARGRPLWHRFYLAAIALMFLYLARGEQFLVHEAIPNWQTVYWGVGAFVVTATFAVADNSPRSTRIWHVCLMGGLALTAISTVLLEYPRLTPNCLIYQQTPATGCRMPVLEEALEFIGIWISLIGLLGQFSQAVSTPPLFVRRLLLAFPALWILAHPSLLPFVEYQFVAQPTAIEYDGKISVRGYRIERDNESLTLAFFTSALSRRRHDMLGYSVHLVDQQSGVSVAGADALINDQFLWRKMEVVYRQQIRVEIPPEAQPNRALWLVLTLWREEDGGYLPSTIAMSDRQELGQGQVVLSELVLTAETKTTGAEGQYVFDNGFALGRVELPSSAIAGASLPINFAWSSDADGGEDIVQFLHFYHEESGEWWVYDQRPLGPRLPTRLWYEGLADAETWEIPLPSDLAPGEYQIFTGLYRLRDSERLPASDATGKPFANAHVPLGRITIEKR